MKIEDQDLGLKKNYLYEILATTFTKNNSQGEVIPNTSCMGIIISELNLIKIGPYPHTTTYKNLKENRYISINLVGNVYLYALAALKEPDSFIGITEFPRKYYEYKELTVNSKKEPLKSKILVPYIRKSWGLFICKVIEENQRIKKNQLGETKITEFNLEILLSEKLRESFKLFNRAENLTLEIILLATRLKVAKEKNDQQLFDDIHDKIIDHMENVQRFGKNRHAFKAIDIVSEYISNLIG